MIIDILLVIGFCLLLLLSLFPMVYVVGRKRGGVCFLFFWGSHLVYVLVHQRCMTYRLKIYARILLMLITTS